MKFRFPWVSAAAIACASVLVSACGGGGDGDSAPPPRFEGALEIDDPGRTGSFVDYAALTEFTAIALEDGTLWFTFPNLGVGQAKFTTGRPQYSVNTGKILEYLFDGSDVQLGNPAIRNSSYSIGYRFQVLNESPNPVALGYRFPLFSSFGGINFFGSPKQIPVARYDYNRAASLNETAGTWGQTLTISTTGVLSSNSVSVKVGGAAEFGRVPPTQFSVETTTVCSLTGRLVPRLSGKNVFDVTLSASGSGCVIAGQSYTGVAVAYLDKTNAPRLQVMTLNAGKNSYASLSLERGGVL